MLLRVISLMRFWRRVNFARIMPDVSLPVPGMGLNIVSLSCFWYVRLWREMVGFRGDYVV
jgi:hypothetical protein